MNPQAGLDPISSVLSSIVAPVLVLDPEGRLLRCNTECERLTGYRWEDLAGTTLWDALIAPEEVDAVEALFGGLAGGRFPERHLMTLITARGERVGVTWHNKLVLDWVHGAPRYVVSTGEVVPVSGTGVGPLGVPPLTRELADALHAPVLLLDSQLRLLHANRACHELFPERPPPAPGEPIERWSLVREVEGLDELLAGLAGQGRAFEAHVVRVAGLGVLRCAGRVAEGVPRVLLVTVERSAEAGSEVEELDASGLFERLAVTAPFALAVLDGDGRVAAWSPGMERLLGWRAEQVLGRPGPLMTGGEDFSDLWRAAWEAHATRELETRWETREGTSVAVRVSAEPILDAEGGVSALLVTAVDISDRLKTEAALQQSEERYRLASSAGHVGVWDWDVDSDRLYVDPSLKTMLGYRDEELPRRMEEWGRLVHPEDRNRVMAEVYACAKGLRVDYALEHRMQAGDGEVVWVLARGSVLRRAGGQAYRLLGTYTDITDLRKAEEALRQSESEQRALLAALPDLMFEVGANGVFRDCRVPPRAAHLEGFRELIGRSVTNAFPEPLGEEVVQQVAAALASGEVSLIEFQLPTPDGPVRHFEARIVARSEDSALLILRDITARRLLEDALRSSEERMRTVLQNMPVMLVAFDPAGHINVWNRECERITGFAAGEVVGDPEALDRLFPDAEYRERLHAEMAQHGGAYRDWEVRLTGKDGSTRTVAMSNFSREFPIAGWADWKIGVDISRRVEAEAEVRRLNAELEARVVQRTAELETSNRELEAFAYSVSHDLRAPLRGIDGFSLALLEDYGEGLDSRARDYLERIRASAQRMGGLIDDLLTLSRVSRAILRRERVDLTALVRRIARELAEGDPERRVAFEVADGLTAHADRSLLEVVLRNLLGNAWKFTSRRREAHIEVATAEREGRRWFVVRDDGVGFDMQYVGKLFHAFQRLHSPAEYEGAGVGLATVQRVVARHGGKLFAEGEVDAGASFYFTLGNEAP
jgi:PAS domain S-box-containing protein